MPIKVIHDISDLFNIISFLFLLFLFMVDREKTSIYLKCSVDFIMFLFFVPIFLDLYLNVTGHQT